MIQQTQPPCAETQAPCAMPCVQHSPAQQRATANRQLQLVSSMGASLLASGADLEAALAVLARALRLAGGYARTEIGLAWPDGRCVRVESPRDPTRPFRVRSRAHRVDLPVTTGLAGWIDAWPRAPAPMDDDDHAALHSWAEVVAGTVERVTREQARTRTEMALRRQVERQAILIDLNRRTLGAPTLNALASHVVDAVAEHLDLDHVSVLEYLAAEEQLLVRAERPALRGPGSRFAVSPASQAGFTLRSTQPVLVVDLQRETRFPDAAFLLEQGFQSGGSAVIPGRDGPWGVVSGHARRAGALTQEDLLFLEAVAALLGAYADHCRVDEELRSSDGLSLSVLESLTGPAALVDANGRITAANSAWEQLMLEIPAQWRTGSAAPADLLALFERAASEGAWRIAEIIAGLRSVLAGEERLVRVEFAIPGPPTTWFAARIARRVDPRGGAIILLVDISEQVELRRELEHQALHDGLTGLPNRGLLFDRLDRALARRAVGTGTVAVFFIDLDRFKVFNDGQGHTRGDRLLVTVARRLRSTADPNDTVARLGGDEFVIVREGVGERGDAEAFADRILHAFAEPFEVGEGREVTITASVGIALARAYSDADSLLRDADVAMYRAKKRGGARAESFDHESGDTVVERYATEDELRAAVPNEELRIRYQPIVELDSGRVVGVEALVRWNHPARGLLAPAEFLTIAYESGLIVPVGNWVLREACHFAQAMTDAAGGPSTGGIGADRPAPTISINISPHQLAQPDFVEFVEAVVAEARLDPRQLVFELTETVLFETDPSTAETLAALGALGIKIVIDDFGTGYASLQYLKRFPIAGLKIDQSFVDDVVDDPDDAAIVASILALAANTGIHAVAEGIESEAQRHLLHHMGCRFGQGFLFGGPEPAEVVIARFTAAVG